MNEQAGQAGTSDLIERERLVGACRPHLTTLDAEQLRRGLARSLFTED